jgi:ectoine hydroxylase-related dioxygenase (phytanoyl-CoA dioxygenase family)
MDISALKQEYNEKGFTIVKDGISLEAIEYLKTTAAALLIPELKKNNLPTDDPLHAGFIALDHIDHKYVSRFFDTLKDTDALCNIVFNDKLISIAKEFMNIPQEKGVYVPYHISRVDPPTDGRFLYKWHQESYYSMFGADQVQIWAPIVVPTTRQNGAMSVLEGAAKDGEIVHHIEKNEGGITQKCIYPEQVEGKYTDYRAELELGEVVFFHPYAVHRSNDNISKEVRYSLVAAYANPYDPKFRYGSQAEMGEYHAKRCSNYAEFAT